MKLNALKIYNNLVFKKKHYLCTENLSISFKLTDDVTYSHNLIVLNKNEKVSFILCCYRCSIFVFLW
jgi:hypothetical protein